MPHIYKNNMTINLCRLITTCLKVRQLLSIAIDITEQQKEIT